MHMYWSFTYSNLNILYMHVLLLMHLFFVLFLLNYCFTCVVSTNDYFKDEFHYEVINTCTDNFGISDYKMKKTIKSAVLSLNIPRNYLFMFVNITYTISKKQNPPCFCLSPSLFSFSSTYWKHIHERYPLSSRESDLRLASG